MAKFGATKVSVKERCRRLNIKREDKLKVIAVVKSKNPFKEENEFRWFLADHLSYYGIEFFPLNKTNLFFEFFKNRIIEGGFE
mgnify:CR=1 FL=1